MSSASQPPQLSGVEHRYITAPDSARIHVADADPADGPAIMLVHGFPQHWWEWHRLIGPLAADGYRVLAPDLRGTGWSEAPRGTYPKAGMAADLLSALDQLGVERASVAAHAWGGMAGSILALRSPERVAGFAGFNTAAPWLKLDGTGLRHAPAFFYQYPLAHRASGRAWSAGSAAATGGQRQRRDLPEPLAGFRARICGLTVVSNLPSSRVTSLGPGRL